MVNRDLPLVDINNIYSMYIYQSINNSDKFGMPYLLFEIRNSENNMVACGESTGIDLMGLALNANQLRNDDYIEANSLIFYFNGSYENSEDLIELDDVVKSAFEEFIGTKMFHINN